jgi:hypothetical protein
MASWSWHCVQQVLRAAGSWGTMCLTCNTCTPCGKLMTITLRPRLRGCNCNMYLCLVAWPLLLLLPGLPSADMHG